MEMCKYLIVLYCTWINVLSYFSPLKLTQRAPKAIPLPSLFLANVQLLKTKWINDNS